MALTYRFFEGKLKSNSAPQWQLTTLYSSCTLHMQLTWRKHTYILTFETSGTIISVADDTVVICKGSTWENLQFLIEIDSKKIFDSFSHEQLTINFEKKIYCSLHKL